MFSTTLLLLGSAWRTAHTPGFATAAIADPRVSFGDGRLVVSWTSSAPAGTWYQVYVDRQLLYAGTLTRCVLPWPTGPCQVDIGTVASGSDAQVDYAGMLTSGTAARALLTWQGTPTADRYRIYRGTAPGGAVSYAQPIASVPAQHAHLAMDGWNLGGWNTGGWGHAATTYTWRSAGLAPGTWNFAVAAVDVAGNATGTPATTAVTIAGPPRPPAADASGVRLHATLAVASGWNVAGWNTGGWNVGPTTRTPTLTWSASPP